MLKFGKKVTYRPLIVSLTLAIIIGSLFGFNISSKLGLEVGTIMFLVMFLGHYLFVLPIIFNYWEISNDFIRYSDIKPLQKRLLTILLPKYSPMKSLFKSQIQQVTIIGLPQHDTDLTSTLIVSEEGGFMYNLLLMINEPVKIRLTLINNQTVDLDLSRDYVRHPSETLSKLKLFLDEFSPEIVHISPEVQQAINYR